MYYVKIPRENRPEALCFMRCYNAPYYDVTTKEARSWCKICFVTRVLLEHEMAL